MTGVINTGVLALLPIIVAEFDWTISTSQAAILTISAAQLGGLISQWPTGILSDRLPRRLVMSIMFLVGGLAALALFLFAGHLNFIAFLCIIGIWGSGSLSIYGIAVAHGLDRADSDDVTPLMSTYLFVWATGSIIGPLLFGAAIAINGFFAGMALIMVGMSAALIIRLRVTAPPPPEDQDDFSPVLATSTAISQVDPRVSDD
jgi:MFS family permease